MKAIRNVLIIVLVFAVVVTGYYSFRRYVINDNMKGISPNNLLNIGIFLIIPICIGLFMIKRFGKKKKRRHKNTYAQQSTKY